MNTNKGIYVFDDTEDDDDFDADYDNDYDEEYIYKYDDDCPDTLANLMKIELKKVLRKYQPYNQKNYKRVNKMTDSMFFDMFVDNRLIKYIMFDENDGLIGHYEELYISQRKFIDFDDVEQICFEPTNPNNVIIADFTVNLVIYPRYFFQDSINYIILIGNVSNKQTSEQLIEKNLQHKKKIEGLLKDYLARWLLRKNA